MTQALVALALIVAAAIYFDLTRRQSLAAERERLARLDAATLALKEREIALSERKLDIHAARVARPAQKADMIPVDLLTDALSESERWAREDKLKYLQDLYAQSGSWNNVRSVVGVND